MATKKKTKKRDWLKLKLEYQTTGISQRDLAEKHSIPYATVKTRCSREQWVRDKENIASRIEAEVTQKTIEDIVNQKVETNKRHIALIDESLDVVQHLLQTYKQELAEGKKRTKASAYTIDYLMSAILKAQKGQRLALNIDSEDVEEIEPEIAIIEGVDLNKI